MNLKAAGALRGPAAPVSRRTVMSTGTAAAVMTGLPEEMSPTVLRVGDPFRRFSLLKPGTRRYVVTREMEGAVSARGVITKTISFEPHAGRPAVHIVQTTEGGSRVVWDSWFEPETFRPLTHDRTTRR